MTHATHANRATPAAAPANASVWSLMTVVRGRIACALLCSGLSSLASLAAVGLMASLLAVLAEGGADGGADAMPGEMAPTLPGAGWWVAAGLVGAVVMAYSLRIVAFQLSHRAAFRLENHLRGELFGKLIRLPMGTVQGVGAGALGKVVLDDVRELHGFVADSSPIYARVTVAPLLLLALLFYLDWRLALVVVSVLAVLVAYLGAVMRRNDALGKRFGQAREALNGAIVEFIQAMPVVRTFDAGHASFGRYQRALDAFSAFVGQWYREVAGSGNVLMVLLNPLFTLLLLVWLGAWWHWDGSLPAVRWIAFLLLSSALAETVLPLLFLQSTLQRIGAPVRRIHELRAMAELPAVGDTQAKVPTDASVCFRQVSFAYAAEAPPALAEVSFDAPAGSTTALVGASGAGKSTVARLIARFWDVSAGQVRVGGVDVRELRADVLAAHVAFVAQDCFLFAGSVADNLRIGRPDATPAELQRAAEQAQADGFIRRLPQGYETVVGERGAFLSGGQRQRLAIARAILQDKPILVLDEATAFADTENEAAIMAALAALMRGRTVLLIAHRLHTVRDADRILVFDGGRIVEAGTHDALLAANGRYAGLWRRQQAALDWQLRVGTEGQLA